VTEVVATESARQATRKGDSHEHTTFLDSAHQLDDHDHFRWHRGDANTTARDLPMLGQQVDGTRQAGDLNKRALILADGGAAGNAWELGLIAACQITSGTRSAELHAAILAEVPQPQAGDAGSDRGRARNFSGPNYMEWSGVVERNYRFC
jgi:hypothetical protein